MGVLPIKQKPTHKVARIGKKLYDIQTKNRSFLQVAMDLKKLGIKNYYFMLEIYDISLLNIDPFACDPKTGKTTLTQDQVQRIVTECKINPWYYLREICRIPDPGGTAVPYLANRGNIAQAWCIWKGIDSWLCLPRQQGKTQSALAMQTWAYLFGTTNSSFIFVNKDGENAKSNLKRLKDQIDLLPEYLRFYSIVDEETGSRIKGIDNATKLVHPFNNNQIIVKAGAQSKEKAISLARGLTAPIIHYDEPEFTNYIKEIIENSASTYDTASARAKENGGMYGRIFTCTPGDLDSAAGMEAQEVLSNCAQWTEQFYDWSQKQIDDFFEAHGTFCNKIVYIEYQWYQIGKTREWLNKMISLIGNQLTFRREILLQRLHGSSTSPYPQEDIEAISAMVHNPIGELWLCNYYKFDLYAELDKDTPYICGIDCSTGTCSDNNAITILDPYTIEPVAEFRCPYIGETKYEALLMELVQKHLPKAVLCIERNSVGDGIIDHLLHSPIRFNIYYDKSKDFVEEKIKDETEITSMLKKQAAMKTFYGVYTEKNSREAMFAILARHVNEYKEKFITKFITEDLSRLVRFSSGKIAAGTGFHDDNIMSYLIALYVYYHGDNLATFGITKAARREELDNSGMHHLRASEIDPSLVDPKIIESVKQIEAQEAQPNWEDLVRKTMAMSQEQTMQLIQSGNVHNSVYDSTPDELLQEPSGYQGMDLDLGMFDALNGGI